MRNGRCAPSLVDAHAQPVVAELLRAVTMGGLSHRSRSASPATTEASNSLGSTQTAPMANATLAARHLPAFLRRRRSPRLQAVASIRGAGERKRVAGQFKHEYNTTPAPGSARAAPGHGGNNVNLQWDQGMGTRARSFSCAARPIHARRGRRQPFGVPLSPRAHGRGKFVTARLSSVRVSACGSDLSTGGIARGRQAAAQRADSCVCQRIVGFGVRRRLQPARHHSPDLYPGDCSIQANRYVSQEYLDFWQQVIVHVPRKPPRQKHTRLTPCVQGRGDADAAQPAGLT